MTPEPTNEERQAACDCYISHNLNTRKDELTLSRSCPVHETEATAFYADLDRRTDEAAERRKTERELSESKEVRELRAALTRRDEQIAEARRNALNEALTAVMGERLDDHELYLSGTINDIDGDLAYSRAINDAEEAIRKLATK